MCRKLVSCADFKPFWCFLVKLFEIVTPSKRMERQTTPSIAGQTSLHKLLSPQKVPNRSKTNSSIKPNKFHSKYVCFGGQKTRKERIMCLQIRLFGFSDVLVTRSATAAARKMVSLSTLICPFQFERALKFKWTNQS